MSESQRAGAVDLGRNNALEGSRATAAAVTGLTYFALALGAILLSRQPGNVATLWYANAAGSIALFWRPRTEWPVLLAVVALANLAANLAVGDALAMSLAFIPGNVIEILIAGLLLNRHCRAAATVDNGGRLLLALLLGGLAPGMVGALLGAAMLAALGLAPFSKVWFTWFEGSAIGSVSVLPLGLALLATGWRPIIRTLIRPEVAAVLLLACAVAVFAPIELPYPYVYISVSLVLVAAVGRFAAASVGVLLCSLIVGTLIATGIFQPPPRTGLYSEVLFYLPLLLTLVPPMALAATLDRVDASVQALATREEHFRGLYEKTPVMMHSVDREGLLVSVNATWLTRMGYAESEVLGRDAHEFLAPLSRQHAIDVVDPLFARVGRVQGIEYQFVTKSGDVIDVRQGAVWELDDHGQPMRTLAVSEEVTGQKEAERQLRHALQKAQAASQAKSQFLANMSHEIRTPMNAVIGLAYLLERTPLNAEQADTLGKIKFSSQSLLSIINDVLDLSKIEASEMHIEQAPFMLDALLSEVALLSRIQAEAKGVSFELHTRGSLPQAVIGDATRLRQVLGNLLSNAIKFTERGGVQLNVQPLRITNKGARLRFEVKDSGVGIAPEALPKLFAPFVQADTSTTRRFGGTGLGLSIVKQLVTLMGGEVGVHSLPQLGSEFWVEIDLPVCDEAAVVSLMQVAPPPAGPGLYGVRVLVTDDSPINLEVARRILELEGARVWLAGNGQQAVDQLLADPQLVDVVLMDVQMPVLDGHDATRRIRSGLGLKDLPIIALTAGITTGEHERAQAAGMNDVVAKPFDPPALVRCIRRYVAMNKPMPEAPQQQITPHDWPQVEGIDMGAVRARLGGDLALLRSLLQRLLDDFADIEAERVRLEPASLAGRLHNLKGSAGTLGAKSVEHLAALAEDACRGGESQHVEELVRRLAVELSELRSASAAMLQVPTDDGPDAAPGGIDGAALETLLERLRRFDLAAVDTFKALAPHLRALLGPQAFAALRQQIDNLQFDLAAAALQQVEAELERRTPLGSI
jgi:PAS domain S-box-containing protein